MIVTQEELDLFKADCMITGRTAQLERERLRAEISALTARVSALEKEFEAERIALRETDSRIHAAFLAQAQGILPN